MPFPHTWPKYIPKDKVAACIETYVESMELDYWSSTTFQGDDYDRDQGRREARFRLADGKLRTNPPAHIVMATHQTGTQIVRPIHTIKRHSDQVSQYKIGKG